MRTPAGSQCRHYYEDFNRGRSTQECRLIQRNPDSLPWKPDLCAKCKVPEILRANGSKDLRLSLRVSKRFGLLTQLELKARCAGCNQPIKDPIKGCERCAEG